MTAWRDRPLADLLAEFGLAGIEERPFPTDGWSGSTFSAIERGHERFVLKRTSASRDWIVRATRDDGIREAWLANARTATIGWLSDLGGDRSVAYLGAAVDANGAAAILMPDLSTELVAWERPTHEPVARRGRHGPADRPDRPAPRAALERDPRPRTAARRVARPRPGARSPNGSRC